MNHRDARVGRGRGKKRPVRCRPRPESLEDRRLPTIAFVVSGPFDSGNVSYGVALADFNGDSNLDMVVSEAGDQTLALRLGNGDGSFGPPTRFPAVNDAPYTVGRVAAADLNADGNLDLLVTGQNRDALGVYLGRGDGTFDPRLTYDAGGSSTKNLAVADFNGDGKPDVALANSPNIFDPDGRDNLTILFGRGDGTFDPASTIASGMDYWDVVAGDLDGDGDFDLAASANFRVNGYPYPRTLVLLNRGDGTFDATSYPTFPHPPSRIAAADLDGDGDLDLIQDLTHDIRTSLVVLLNRGDGTFEPGAESLIGEDYLSALITADFDGDGKVDVAVQRTGTVQIFPGRGDGTFDPSFGIRYEATSGSLAAGDLNGDGKADLVATGWIPTLSVLLSADPPTFSVADAGAVEGDDGTTGAAFTVSLSPSIAGDTPITVVATPRSGTATAGIDFLADPIALTFQPGETSRTVVVPILGDRVYEGDETFTVELSDPVGATIARGLAVGTIVENEPIPAISLIGGTIAEGADPAAPAACVVLSTPSTRPISVRVARVGGSASAADIGDFADPVLTFAPGETRLAVPLVARDDLLVEGDETIVLALTDLEGIATIAGDGTATVTIRDDERPGVVQFGVGALTVAENAGFAIVTINRTEAGSEAVSVAYATLGGEATGGVDFSEIEGRHTFAPGETSWSFAVPIRDDGVFTGDRSFAVILGGVEGGATQGPLASATITIAEDEAAPVLVEGGAETTPGEGGAGPASPPPLVGVGRVLARSRRGRAAKVVVTFSGDVASGALIKSNYMMISAGKDRRFGTRDDRTSRFRSATYDPSTRTVTLVPARRITPRSPRRLVIASAGPQGLVDRFGRPPLGGSGGEITVAVVPAGPSGRCGRRRA